MEEIMKKTLTTMLMLVALTLVFAQANNLFFSEYIEGSSNNKAVEIFNGTGATVDLSGYSVKLGSNGNEWSSTNFINLEGSLANGSVFVIANAQAAAAIMNVSDATSTVTYFNGNDAVALFQGDTMIDIIGVYQEDPGTAWDVAGVAGATLNHTLIRKPHIIQGNLNWAASAGTNMDDSEWLVEAQDYFDNIGSHVFNPGGGDIAGTPTFNPPAGAYTQPINVTISSSTAGATIRYTLNGSEPTESSTVYSTPINVSANTTIKAKAWADGFDPSYTATAAYVFPVMVQNISQLRQQAADNSTLYYVSGNAILTFKQSFNNQKYVQDGDAAILIHDPAGVLSTNYEIGDAIQGLNGTLGVFNNTLQLYPAVNPGPAVSSGNYIHVPTVTIAELNADMGVGNYQSRLVYINGVSFANPTGNFATGQNYDISDNTGSMVFRTSFYDADYIGSPLQTNVFSLRGIVTQYQTTPTLPMINQITPRMLADFNPVSNNDEVQTPAQVALIGNYPNPFNPETTIKFQMGKAAPATIEIYNQKGQIVKSFDFAQAKAGVNNIVWNGLDNNGSSVSSGVYFFRLKSGSYSSTKKMVLMK